MIYALVDRSNGRIVNSVDVEDNTKWAPPEGHYLLEGAYGIGGSVLDGVYVAPDVPRPSPIPAQTYVTPRQARLALYVFGLLEKVEAAVAAEGGTTKIAWDYATQIDRTDPLVTALSSALGITDEQLDDLFALAATL